MKQVFQSLDSGETRVLEVPAPGPRRGHLLIHTTASVVSAGTERMLMEFGRGNPIQKARQQPEKVRQVLDKARTDGIQATVDAVRSKLAEPLPLGYSNAGVVLAVGEGIDDIQAGDRVISNGPHAEVVSVPRNLCAKIPTEDIPDEHAAFTVLGAIGLQGIRLAAPTLGERFVVTGLGLIGLLTVQLLRAHGCAVLGIDPDSRRCELAREFGAETVELGPNVDPLQAAQAFSRGRGVDGVLITASTKSNEPVRQAAQMCRKRGRIILVGVTGLELSRELFYEKELTFQISCSYGPGRYDPTYEEHGQDYPLGFVRWTEARNFEAVLDMLGVGHLTLEPLITHRVAIDKAEAAYGLLEETQETLGIVLTYPQPTSTVSTPERSVRHLSQPNPAPLATGRKPRIGIIGAGAFTAGTLLPILRKLDCELTVIASPSGSTAGATAQRFDIARSTSDIQEVLEDDSVDTVFITTRHDSHASLAIAALQAGKAVYVEKPLAITHEQLDAVQEAYAKLGVSAPVLTVGFNRRSAPHVALMRKHLNGRSQPLTLITTVNAGYLPDDHWLHDPDKGGGRLIGEGCHFLDLARHLIACPISDIDVTHTSSRHTPPSFTITMQFEDRSLAILHYLDHGHPRYPKERYDVFCGGRTLTLINFRSLTGYGWKGIRPSLSYRQDKGHSRHVAAHLDALRDGVPGPTAPDEIFEVTHWSLTAHERTLNPR